jgi:hypothetical protein
VLIPEKRISKDIIANWLALISTVPPEVEASYSAIIDDILATSNINTVSAKHIRRGLQAKVGYDITPQKVLGLLHQARSQCASDVNTNSPHRKTSQPL